MSRPPRMASLVMGVNASGALDPAMPSWLKCAVHPLATTLDLTQSFGGYNPPDTFFRLLPPVGGQNTLLMVMEIRVVRYRMDEVVNGTRDGIRLPKQKIVYRTVYDPKTRTFTGDHRVGGGIEKVTFHRSSVTIPSVTLAIQMQVDPTGVRGVGGQGQ